MFIWRYYYIILGHEISSNGVSIPEDHLRTIRELKCPDTGKGMRKVMGFMNFFRGHVRNFAKLSGPLIEFMNAKKQPLTEVHIRCFEEMRQCLLNSPILKVIDYNCKPVEFQLEVDALTKYTICCPCKKTYSAMDVAKMLMNEVFSVFCQHKIISDKDIRFMNLVFDYIYEYYQIQMATTSTNNPAANGQVESINKSVVTVLRAYCGLESAHWSTYIKIVQFTLNTHWAKAILMTPYQAVFGRLPRDQYGLSDFYMNHSNADAAALVTRAQLIRTYIKDNLSRYYDDLEEKLIRVKGYSLQIGRFSTFTS